MRQGLRHPGDRPRRRSGRKQPRARRHEHSERARVRAVLPARLRADESVAGAARRWRASLPRQPRVPRRPRAQRLAPVRRVARNCERARHDGRRRVSRDAWRRRVDGRRHRDVRRRDTHCGVRLFRHPGTCTSGGTLTGPTPSDNETTGGSCSRRGSGCGQSGRRRQPKRTRRQPSIRRSASPEMGYPLRPVAEIPRRSGFQLVRGRKDVNAGRFTRSREARCPFDRESFCLCRSGWYFS